MRRKVTVVFFAALLTFVVLSMASGPVKAETIILKAVTGWPKPSSENISFFIFTELVEQMVAKK